LDLCRNGRCHSGYSPCCSLLPPSLRHGSLNIPG
jgi:hypothetical protein